MTETTWTREALEALREMDRPRVRCKIDRVNITEDKIRIPTGPHSFNASITVDGNNPWLTSTVAGQCVAFRVSWPLVCEVLNDRFATPIHFPGIAEYEV